MRSPPKIRSRSSCSERLNRELPGSPWRPARPAELVVDAPRFVPLGAGDVQAAERDDLVVLGIGLFFEPRIELIPTLPGHAVELAQMMEMVELLIAEERPLVGRQKLGDLLPETSVFGHELGISAEQNVGAAAGHVGGNRHRALAARLRDDKRLALVILGVQHFMPDAHPLEHARELFGFLDRDRAHQHGLALLVAAP